MQTISVPLNNRSYPIWIDYGLLTTLPEILKTLNHGQIWVIFSQNNIINQYGSTFVKVLQKSGYKIEIIILSDGEKSKALSSMQGLISKLLQFGCDRSSTFIAMGGGVVGDVTGFIAATFMRGVDYVQIPTTLLAMVDSGIGGKTSVNLPEGKNLMGVFWQPTAVAIDPQFLQTLPKRDFSSAFGEIIKYGAILDRDLLVLISNNIDQLIAGKQKDILEKIIISCVKLKVNIIVADEREGDKRRILNFGHTIGHALETYYGFEMLRHGEAISYGMLAAGKLSIKYANLDKANYNLLKETINKLSLPNLPDYNSDKIIQIMQHDKKIINGEHHFILIEEIGKALIKTNISNKSLVQVLDGL